MANLKDLLYKRRGLYYSGETLEQAVNYFMTLVEAQGSEVYTFKDATILLTPHGLPGNVKGYLLFDKFTKGTVSAIQKVSNEFKGKAIYTSSHDVRIRDLLLKLGYIQYLETSDPIDYFLVKRNKDVLYERI